MIDPQKCMKTIELCCFLNKRVKQHGIDGILGQFNDAEKRERLIRSRVGQHAAAWRGELVTITKSPSLGHYTLTLRPLQTKLKIQ